MERNTTNVNIERNTEDTGTLHFKFLASDMSQAVRLGHA